MARRRLRSAGAADEEVPGVTNLEPLAAGGSSTVYRAWQPGLDRWVAVKIPNIMLTNDRARARFVRECSAVGRLTGHPNIVTVHGAGTTRSDRPFLTMDLFAKSLADVIAEPVPVPVEDVLHHGVKLAGALETAHRAEILHRDIKPENVLLSSYGPHGDPVLADFGIATLGEARGATEAFTASHAAPEVLDGQAASPAADVYGLGSTLWTALAGRLPFGDGSEGPARLIRRVLEEPLPPLGRDDVPPAVEEALRWAMAKRPAERPSSAAAFGQRLCALQAELDLAVSELLVRDDPDRSVARHERSPAPSSAASSAAPVAHPPAETIRPPLRAGRPDPRRAPATHSRGGEEEVPAPPPPARSRRERRSDRHDQAQVPTDPGAPSRRPAPLVLGVVVVGLVLLLASVSVIVSRRPPPSPASTTPSTSSAPAPGLTPSAPAAPTTSVAPTTTGAPTTAVAPPPSSNRPTTDRTPTNVAVTTAGRAGAQDVTVTWTPPADRGGLRGYLVVSSLKAGGGQVASRPVNDPDAVDAMATLAGTEPRCFVVEAVYKTGPRGFSTAACT